MALGKKTGGRVKGTPNKSTQFCKATIMAILKDYDESGLMTKDFMALEPKDRLTISEKLMQYVMPKCQAIAVDVQSADDTTKSIEERLTQMITKED